MKKTLIKNLIDQLIEVEKGTPWLDETFEKKFGMIKPEQAFSRPFPDIHSLAEIMSHLIEWRFEIIHRLNGNERQLSAESPENWQSIEELKKFSWNDLVDQFKKSQTELISILQTKDDSFLNTPFGEKDYRYLVEGVIHHDLYHLGQIGLVNKMLTT